MLKGFRDFILRGNVIDLAVAVVVGAAFTSVVGALVDGVFNPLIGALFNAESLSTAFVVEIPLVTGSAKLAFGAVIGALIQFLLTAAVLYFAFVLPINTLRKKVEARRKAGEEAEPAAASEADLLAEIRDLLKAQAASK